MKRKKLQTNRIFRLGSAAVILAAAALAVIFFKDKLSQARTEENLKGYIGYINEADYEGMYEMLDSASRAKITKEEFCTKHENIYGGIEAENVVIEILETNKKKDDSREVVYKVKMNSIAGDISFTNKALFVKEGQEYFISWNPGAIFPELAESDKVRVYTGEAKRGSILDRNGSLLAGPGEAALVGLVPGKMTNETDLEALAELLELGRDQVEDKLNAAWVAEDSFVPIKLMEKPESIYDNEAEYLMQETLLTIPGVQINTTEVRSYPLGAKAAHLTGYIQNITAEELKQDQEGIYHANSSIGKSGIEKLFEERLRGKNGVKVVIENKEGKTKRILASVETEDGDNIRLTIDAKLQAMLYEQYQEDKSASVAMNPKTGEVLALVSTPAYDANDFVLGLSENKWNRLNEDEDKPMYNRYSAAWTPGSALKPVIAAIGISAGVLDRQEDLGDSGLSWQKDESWGSYKITTLHEHKKAVLKNALIYSDNIYFAKAALKIGQEQLEESLNQIGFEEIIPFPIGMAKSAYAGEEGIKNEIQLADSGYGQGEMLLNPLHLASLYSAFANEGNMIRPYLEYDQGRSSEYWIEQAFTEEAARDVEDGLIAVVNDPAGTGYGAKLEDVVLAGKTGTAEIKLSKADSAGTELGWFCVYTPENEKEDSLLLITMVEDVKDRGGSGYVVNGTKYILGQLFKDDN